jgi:hypothetical protein
MTIARTIYYLFCALVWASMALDVWHALASGDPLFRIGATFACVSTGVDMVVYAFEKK